MANLPIPNRDAQATSQRLIELLAQEKQPLSFRDFMQAALYAPGLGYYTAGSTKFNAAGDFVTAPEISSLFARALAQQCGEIISQFSLQKKECDILEFGAGSGQLAIDLLMELAKLDNLPTHYYIIEISADLRQRQQDLIQEQLSSELCKKIIWLDTLPKKLQGIVLANEVLDAMPVHRVHFNGDSWQEYYVRVNTQALEWELGPLSNTVLAQHCALLNQHYDLTAPYSTEVNLALVPWLNSLSDFLTMGVVILVDYGFPQREYYHPDRTQGTLICHYRHHSHPDPLWWPGLQDITAHIDFTLLAESAYQAGFTINGYLTQADFLLNNQVLVLINQGSEKEQLLQSQQLKKLLMPWEMGELFKVMLLTKAYSFPLSSIRARNQLVTL